MAKKSPPVSAGMTEMEQNLPALIKDFMKYAFYFISAGIIGKRFSFKKFYFKWFYSLYLFCNHIVHGLETMVLNGIYVVEMNK